MVMLNSAIPTFRVMRIYLVILLLRAMNSKATQLFILYIRLDFIGLCYFGRFVFLAFSKTLRLF